MGNTIRFVQRMRLRSLACAVAAFCVLTLLVASGITLHRRDGVLDEDANSYDDFVPSAEFVRHEADVLPSNWVRMGHDRFQRVFAGQKQFYQRNIEARNRRIARKDNVERDHSIFFMYEALWWCPYGAQMNGNHGDGMKWTCGMSLLALRPSMVEYQRLLAQEANADTGSRVRPPCVVYSAGSNNDAQFEDDIKAHTNCDIHIFDPAKNGPKGYENGNWNAQYSYHSTKISGSDGPDTLTLKHLLAHFGHKSVDILKMDIEGDEVHFFNTIDPEDLKRIGQIQVELHDPTYEQMIRFFSKVEANGFRIFHKEVNPLDLRACEYALVNTAWDPEFGFEK